jgi:hypothetical protein
MDDLNDTPAAANDDKIVDPELEALLGFEPVPRKYKRANAWTPALQRRFIAKLVELGSPARACEALGKDRFGVEKLYKSEGAEGFRDAWARALEIFEERDAARQEAERSQWLGVRPPGGVDRRMDGARPSGGSVRDGPLPGQVLNELGEYEDEGSFRERVEDARDSISKKLTNARRLYLQEISSSPGKRAAFEILTELPIDWDKAERLEAQADEPWRRPNMRQPDMLLTAENGWLGGEFVHGEDKKAELRRAIDEHRAEEGLPPVDWGLEADFHAD